MNTYELWIGLAIGLAPYRIERRWTRGRTRITEVQALFWTLTIQRRPSDRRDWTLTVPLFKRLRDAAWAAIAKLRSGE